MHHLTIKLCSLLILSLSLTTGSYANEPPDPATRSTFTLPLQNGKEATAELLPVTSDQMYLVYATPTGELGVWTLSRSVDPIPPDPIPPVPPFPTKLFIAVVENPLTTSQAQRHVLADPGWRKKAIESHNFLGVVPSDLVDKETGGPPAHLRPFLKQAASRKLPWLIMCDQSGRIVFESEVPETVEEMEALIPRNRKQESKNARDNK